MVSQPKCIPLVETATAFLKELKTDSVYPLIEAITHSMEKHFYFQSWAVFRIESSKTKLPRGGYLSVSRCRPIPIQWSWSISSVVNASKQEEVEGFWNSLCEELKAGVEGMKPRFPDLQWEFANGNNFQVRKAAFTILQIVLSGKTVERTFFSPTTKPSKREIWSFENTDKGLTLGGDIVDQAAASLLKALAEYLHGTS